MNSFECEWNLLKDVLCYYLFVIMVYEDTDCKECVKHSKDKAVQ